jgi:hypothetical protein
MKVNLAAQVMSHTVAASLNVLVASGKEHCTVCCELCALMIEVANANNEGYFSKLLSPETSSQTHIIVMIYYLTKLYINIQVMLNMSQMLMSLG